MTDARAAFGMGVTRGANHSSSGKAVRGLVDSSTFACRDLIMARFSVCIPVYNGAAFVEQALAEAEERDAARARGESTGPLHGVPVAIKEEVDVAGAVTTFGGRTNVTPAAADAETVRRLRAAGRVPAVLYGHGQAPRHIALPAREFRGDAPAATVVHVSAARS